MFRNFRTRLPARAFLGLLLFFATALLPQNQRSSVALFNEGEAALLRRDYRSAVQNYRAAIDRNPSYIRAHAGLARALFEQGDYVSALESCEAILGLEKGNRTARTLKGRILLRQGHARLALDMLSAVAKEDPGNTENAYALGEYYARTGKHDVARGFFEKVLRREPGHLPALIGLADSQAVKGSLDAAERTLERARELDPAYPGVHLGTGRIFLSRALREKDERIRSSLLVRAREALLSAESLASEMPEIQLQLIRIEMALGQGERARDRAAALRKMSVRPQGADQVLAYVERTVGRKEDAVQILRESLRLEPANPLVRAALEELVMELPGDARLSELRRELTRYHERRAQNHRNQQRFDRALPHYRRALLLDPGAGGPLRELSEHYRMRGNYELFLQSLIRLRDREENDPKLRFRLESALAGRRESLAYKENLLSPEGSGSAATFARTPTQILIFDPEPVDGLPEAPDASEWISRLFDFYLRGSSRIRPVDKTFRERLLRMVRDSRPQGRTFSAGVFYRPDLVPYLSEIDDELNRPLYFAAGKILVRDGRFAWTLDLVERRTGKVIARTELRAEGEDALHDLCSRAAAFVERSLPYSGRVVRIGTDRVFINLGMEDGVAKGQVFSVENSYGAERGTVKVEEVGSYVSRVSAVEGRLSALHMGDVVRPKPTAISGQ